MQSMQKNLWLSLLLVSICLIFLPAASSPVAAQEESPDIIDYQPGGIEEELGDVIPFEVLGFDYQTLTGTKLETNFSFILPAHWELLEGASLSLDIITSFYSNNIRSDDVIPGELAVFLNGVLLDTILLEKNGPQTVVVSLPKEALIPLFQKNSRHLLTFKLNTNTGCNSTQSTNVRIQPSSYFTFPHQFVAPDLNLERLPYPIQQRSFLPDNALIVIPDSPSLGELQAFVTISAGLGRFANKTNYGLVRISEMTEEMRSNNHLILVGTSENFTELGDLSLTKLVDFEDTDGILQISQSPWNPTKAILYVGGNNDESTLKAARAIGYGTIRADVGNTFASINEVYFENNQPLPYKARQTIADLGYELTTLKGPSITSASFSFFIPLGMEISSEETPTFLFEYNHSALLQYDLSGINISLNDRPVHSFSIHEGSTAVTQELVELPPVLLNPGPNTIKVEVELEPFDKCSDFRSEGTWLNIFPESTIYIPLEVKSNAAISVPMINQYPQPMVFDQMLSTTTFVLPKEDTAAWFSAFQLAADLGRRGTNELINLEVAYADDVTDTMRESNNLILIGLPSELPILEDLAAYLPVPISRDTNRFEHDRLPIEYDIPPEVSLGYINILNSPWHDNFIILSVMGDSEKGLQQATQTLLYSYRNLDGDFVVTEGDQTFTTMTPLLESADEASDEPVDNSDGTGEVALTEEQEPVKSEGNEGETAVVSDDQLSTDDGVSDATLQSDIEQAGEETAVSPTPSSTNNNSASSTVERQGLTLPIAVLVICAIALLGLGIRVLWLRR